MSEEKSLLQQGIEAAREGNKEKARKIFEQVLEKEEENVKAWLWLYRVVDDENEKRICLTTVLQLDPGNEKAQQLLDKLDARAKKAKADEEIVPGITRRQLTLIGGGAAIFVIVVIVVVLLIVSGNRARQVSQDQTATALVVAPTQTFEAFNQQSTATSEAAAAQATVAAETLFAVASPTPTATPTRAGPTLPPENTATPTPTPQQAATPLAPPNGVPGKIVAWSGRDIQNNDFLPIVTFMVSTGQSSRVGSEIGRYPDIDPGGGRIVYTRFYPTTYDFGLEAINVNGTQAEDLARRWRGSGLSFIKPEMSSLGANGNQLVFVANDSRLLTSQVYLLNLGSSSLIQLTRDSATYTYPALSPNGTKVAVVRNDKNSAAPGEDIVIIEIATQSQTPLTSDFGTFIESSPRWSPDGTQIVYAAAQATDPKNSDIVIRPSDGSGAPILPVRSPHNDIFPVFSPDGRYIAFSSNRGGQYDIFIYELATDTLWQLTNTPDEDYPGGWSAN